MANELGNTELSAEIPENWRPRFIERFYEENYVLPRVLNVTGDFKQKGDIAHIEVESFDLTVNSVSADGSLTVQTNTPTDVTVTIDKNKDVTNEWVGKTREQALGLWEKQFPISAGNALREQMEEDILGQYASATLTAQGDGTGNLGEDELLGAIQQHISAKLPIMKKPGEWTLALPDNQFAPLKKLGLLDFDKTGQAGEGGASTMALPKLWNIPVVFSTQVASASSIRYGLLFHNTAMAWAAQRNVTPRMADRLAAAKDSWIATVLALYGVGVVVAGRMGQLKSKA